MTTRRDHGYFVYRNSLVFIYSVNDNDQKYGGILNTNDRYISLNSGPFFINEAIHGPAIPATIADFDKYRVAVHADFKQAKGL
jgi:hypothetical protein